MDKFAFCRIGGYDFQKLVKYFLTKQMGFGIQFYGGSKDRGRDGYFNGEAKFPPHEDIWSGLWIFQAKFRDFIRRGENQMRKEVIDTLEDELDKIINKYKDKCDVYIYLTNIDLTQADIIKMNEIAEKFNISHFEIVHYQHFEAFLDQNENIKWQFPRLLNFSDLESVVKKSLKEKSQAFLEELKENMEVFANTNIFSKALEILNRYNFVTLFGPPKMGKTMIGTALCFIKIRDGFQIYDIIRPDDFLDLYKRSEKQIFMCDDVFGPISYDHTVSESWVRELSKIFSRIDNNHRIIWTTRNLMLQEALENTRLYEYEKKIESEKVYVNVEKLTRVERAHILYNHIKYSKKTQNTNQKIINYLILMKYDIINHKNYSPELINKICSFVIPKLDVETSIDSFKKKIFDFMNGPETALIKDFDNLEEEYKIYLLNLFSFGSRVKKEVLEKKFYKIMEILGLSLIGKFETITKRLNGTYIKYRSNPIETIITFSHPSIMDIINDKWRSDKGIQNLFYKVGGNYILSELLKREFLPSNLKNQLLRSIFENEIFEEITSNLVIIKNMDSDLINDCDIQFIGSMLNKDFFEKYRERSLNFDSILLFIRKFKTLMPELFWLRDLIYTSIKDFDEFFGLYGTEEDLYDLLRLYKDIDPDDFYLFFNDFPHTLDTITDILDGLKNNIVFYDDNDLDKPLDEEYNKVKIAEILNPSIENFNVLLEEFDFYVEPVDIDLEEYYKDFFDEKDGREFQQIQRIKNKQLEDETNIIDFMFHDLEE